ncbi:MAG: redoxin domain-containing protein [Rhizobiales bacterium]|nr:redoxin domain-containing protein [Hyphomicrobiales bacterium]
MTATKKPAAAKAAPKKPAAAKKPAATKKAAAPDSSSGMPAIGKKAPAFSLMSDAGEKVSLATLKGKAAVLYFYPKDDTPGCTVEALDFTALKKKFEAAGAVVYGISKDSVEKHCKFRDKHGLSVTLLSDEEGKMLEAYGVWTEKSLYGRKFMGIVRSTVLLDDKGVVRQVWPKVKVKGHAEEVLAAVKDL